jgi:hypothetical protein
MHINPIAMGVAKCGQMWSNAVKCGRKQDNPVESGQKRSNPVHYIFYPLIFDLIPSTEVN